MKRLTCRREVTIRRHHVRRVLPGALHFPQGSGGSGLLLLTTKVPESVDADGDVVGYVAIITAGWVGVLCVPVDDTSGTALKPFLDRKGQVDALRLARRKRVGPVEVAFVLPRLLGEGTKQGEVCERSVSIMQ